MTHHDGGFFVEWILIGRIFSWFFIHMMVLVIFHSSKELRRGYTLKVFKVRRYLCRPLTEPRALTAAGISLLRFSSREHAEELPPISNTHWEILKTTGLVVEFGLYMKENSAFVFVWLVLIKL